MTHDLGEIAAEVIDGAGGPTKVAKALTKLSGKLVTRDQVQKWKVRGVSPKWAPWLEKISNRSAGEMCPDYYGETA